MARRDPFWTESKRELDGVRRAFRRSPREAAPLFAAYLNRLDACARAARDRGLARRAHRAARLLTRWRAIENDRDILSRLVERGLFAREAAAALEVLWEEKSRARLEKARRKLRGRPGRRLKRALSRRERRRGDPAERLAALAAAREERLSALRARATDRELHRRLRALERRSAAAAAGSRAGIADAAPEEATRAALDRWRNLARFGRRLEGERSSAERRGAVTLALELDRAIVIVDGAIREARRAAIALVARPRSNVIAFAGQSA